MTDPVKLVWPQPARGVYLKVFVVAPPCPHCGPGTMFCLGDTRQAWKDGLGKFYCRRCGFGGVWRVPARVGPRRHYHLPADLEVPEGYPRLEAWVYDGDW